VPGKRHACEIQTNASGHWYWLPLDCFIEAVPSQLWDENEEEGFKTAFDLYHDCIKLISDQGKDIIMDTLYAVSIHSLPLKHG